MSTLNKVNAAYIKAVKDKDPELRDILKLAKAAFSNMEIEKKFEGKIAVEQDYITVLNKLIKKGEESHKIYDEAGDRERAHQETLEINIYRTFVPSQLEHGEVLDLVTAAFIESELPIVQKSMGAIVKLVTEKAEGRANGKVISDIVKQMIAEQAS